MLASFSLRTESALTDPGLDRDDQDFFGRSGLEEPVPGAEAETEKLPTQRPDRVRIRSARRRPAHRTRGPDRAARAGPPEPSSSGPPERD